MDTFFWAQEGQTPVNKSHSPFSLAAISYQHFLSMGSDPIDAPQQALTRETPRGESPVLESSREPFASTPAVISPNAMPCGGTSTRGTAGAQRQRAKARQNRVILMRSFPNEENFLSFLRDIHDHLERSVVVKQKSNH